MRYIITAQPDAMPLALAEAGQVDVMRTLEAGVLLCENVKRPEHPVFLRHICPAEEEIPLTGAVGDIAGLQAAMARLMPKLLGLDGRFSVQTRIIEGYRPGYKRFDVNTALADQIVAAGGVLDVKTPQAVVSVTLAEGAGWLGVSRPEENLSDWAGGARRYKWEEGQVSRAEFKLLEALAVFGVPLADGQRALDLGAAPGGWTRILRRRGLYVVAVDPAKLDPRIAKDKRVTHYPGTAQAYFQQADASFDLMVNDMRMDTAESSQLMVEGSHCLRPGGTALLTLKLPETVATWPERIAQARAILEEAYTVIEMRQLFHNRHEVTVHLQRPSQ